MHTVLTRPAQTTGFMSYTASTSRHLEANILSRSPEWLVPLLYEHLLANLRRAEVQIGAGDIEGKTASLAKASAIVLELTDSLDQERGGDLAQRLAALYAFFLSEIMSDGRSKETNRLARLIAMIADLHVDRAHRERDERLLADQLLRNRFQDLQDGTLPRARGITSQYDWGGRYFATTSADPRLDRRF